MVEREVSVEAVPEPFDPVDEQVRLERMPGPCARHGPEGVLPAHNGPDALRGEEKVRELGERQGLA